MSQLKRSYSVGELGAEDDHDGDLNRNIKALPGGDVPDYRHEAYEPHPHHTTGTTSDEHDSPVRKKDTPSDTSDPIMYPGVTTRRMVTRNMASRASNNPINSKPKLFT